MHYSLFTLLFSSCGELEWVLFAEQALNTIHNLSEQPDMIHDAILTEMNNRVFHLASDANDLAYDIDTLNINNDEPVEKRIC